MRKFLFLIFLFLAFLSLSASGVVLSSNFVLDDKNYASMIERLLPNCREEAKGELEKKLRSGKDLKDTYKLARTEAYQMMDQEIEQRKSLLGKRGIKLLSYEEIDENVKYVWSAFYLQNNQKGLSVEKTIGALNKIDEFKERLKDDTDPLYDINEYRDLHLLPGMSGQLYQLAERTYWRGQRKKALRCMNFFLLPENTDGFSIGAAHYYIGNLLAHSWSELGYKAADKMELEALRHYIKTPQYPTCLTYIAYSYYQAADMAFRLKDYRTSYALASMDVPCVDYDVSSAQRHFFAAHSSYKLDKFTNCVLHIQEAKRHDPDLIIENLVGWIPYYDKESLWNWCFTNKLSEADRYNAVVDALTNETACVELDELYEVLTIEWPKSADLPESVRTNRILNNNFFENLQNESLKRLRQNKKRKEK